MKKEKLKELLSSMVEEQFAAIEAEATAELDAEIKELDEMLTEESVTEEGQVLVEEDSDGADAAGAIDDLKEVLGQLRRFCLRVENMKTPDEYDIICYYQEETIKASDTYAQHYVLVTNVPEALYDKLYDIAYKINPSLILHKGRVKSFSEIGEADCVLYNKHRDYPARALKRINKRV